MWADHHSGGELEHRDSDAHNPKGDTDVTINAVMYNLVRCRLAEIAERQTAAKAKQTQTRGSNALVATVGSRWTSFQLPARCSEKAREMPPPLEISWRTVATEISHETISSHLHS